MKIQVKPIFLTLGLLLHTSVDVLAGNPITINFLNGKTNFSTDEAGSANYVVKLDARVNPPNIPLKLTIKTTGASSKLKATQRLSGASPCGNIALCNRIFPLKAGERCCLAFSLSSTSVGRHSLRPQITSIPLGYSVQTASYLKINTKIVHKNTSLTVSDSAVIPVNATTASITVTNTGAHPAYNVKAKLPSSWTSVTQNSNTCAYINPGDSCKLRFSSTKPYIAQKNIVVTGENITSPPKIALAFSISDYLVFALPTASKALVVENADASTQVKWNAASNAIAGIYQTSVAPSCFGSTDGKCNSTVIVNFYAPALNYAAGLCYQITSDNSGLVAQGTWYLPAVCNINSSDTSTTGSNCTTNEASIYTNLYNLGFELGLNDNYWASTECAYVNTAETNQCNGQLGTYAWVVNFGGDNNTFTAPKNFDLGARCVRSFTY